MEAYKELLWQIETLSLFHAEIHFMITVQTRTIGGIIQDLNLLDLTPKMREIMTRIPVRIENHIEEYVKLRNRDDFTYYRKVLQRKEHTWIAAILRS